VPTLARPGGPGRRHGAARPGPGKGLRRATASRSRAPSIALYKEGEVAPEHGRHRARLGRIRLRGAQPGAGRRDRRCVPRLDRHRRGRSIDSN